MNIFLNHIQFSCNISLCWLVCLHTAHLIDHVDIVIRWILFLICFMCMCHCVAFVLAQSFLVCVLPFAMAADADLTWTKWLIENRIRASTLQLQFLILTTSMRYNAFACNARANIPCIIRVSFRCMSFLHDFFPPSPAHLATFVSLLNIIREQLLSE